MTNTNIKNWCLTLALLASAPAIAFAAPTESQAPMAAAQQANECTGVVVDSFGDPMPGATVKVEGTTIAGATNVDGEFSLKGVANGAKITVNFIGYKPVTVTWQGQPLNIVLEEDDSNMLDEVVVMGYGVEQKRANVTNSIAKVSEKTLTVGTNANPAQALVGAVSGVRVNITTGDPGATPSITVRGGGNFNGGSNEPLIVVDGQIRSSLSDINPNDIDDMQILKDAGATALYGARAGNGVVIITTKKGKAGTGKVTLNAKWGVNSYNDPGYQICSDEDFLYYFRTGKMNSQWALPGGGYPTQAAGLFTGTNGPGETGRTKYDPTQNYNIMRKTADNAYLLDRGWSQMVDPLSDDYILYKGTDILKNNINSPAVTQDYNLSFSGGNDRGNYYASLGYYDADGAVKDTYYKRYNFAFTGSYKLNSWLTSNSVFNYTRSNWLTDNPQINTAYMMNRGIFWKFVNFEDLDGNQMYGNNGPVNVLVNRGKFNRDYETDKFQMTQSFTAQIIDGLSLKGSMSWLYNEYTYDNSNLEYATNNTGAYNMATQNGSLVGMNTQYSASNYFYRYFDQTYNLVANYSKTFADKHNLNVMVGTEFYKRKYLRFSASGTGAPIAGYPDLELTKQDTRSIDSEHLNEALMSYFGRVEYNFDQRYLLAATFREDGYSRLINNRWGFFPGVSAGWVFSNEKFWKENESLGFINYGKLRASFGYNATINSSYLGYYTLRGAYGAYSYDGNIGYRITTLPNQSLKWEKTRTAEVGLTFGFLQNRFNLDLTYYNRLTMDKYASKSLPQTTGFSSIVDNNGSYENQGVEIDINATLLRTRDFQWTLGANLTYNTNRIKKLPYSGLENNRVINTGVEVYTGNGDETHYIGGYQEGQNPYQQVGYLVSHMVRNQADLDALGDYIDVATSYNQPVYATEAGRQRLIAMGYTASNMIRLMPGSFVYEDINGDNKIDNKDRGIIGHSDVHWSGGFNTTVSWKGLSLYARFDMGFGFQVYDSNMSFWLAEGQGAMAFPKQIRETWTPDNPGAKYPRFVWADQYGSDSYVRTNSFFAQNGNYLACRELSLSYQLPENICKKFKSQGLTLSVTGQNLGYIKSCTIPLPDNTTYWTGGTAGNGGTYNLPRTVIFGLNVTF
ncbi:MAG: SusC/RagA family TonB-linked outer membrane protein [Bacteroides sp.]|nr:SusC/RagA family TonB-linked outer membrane protein [Bacteroides sp.]MBD5330904.1 SusC/RagA family TonB-linked outer membrane protein [Bacteroides sp.]MBD5374243.1 SusC/RagA family TonB-linked outer membrane protein [Bacteroides sp.]